MCLAALKKSTFTGLRRSGIGASQGNYGGGTGYLHIIAEAAVR